MKMSKYLVFKVNNQKYALQTRNVVNVIEHVKLIHQLDGEKKGMTVFNFKGISIQFLDFHQLVGAKRLDESVAEFILIAEVNLNGAHKIIGISIDEIIEVSEIEDIMNYPFNPIYNNRTCDIRESIVVYKGEPLTLLNTSRLRSEQSLQTRHEHTEVFVN